MEHNPQKRVAMNSLQKYLYNFKALALAFLILLLIVFVVLWKLIPPPPKTIVIATGSKSGLYYAFGEKLKTELAKDGVTVIVKNTAGAVDNLALLNDPNSGVDFAIIQGGVADVDRYPEFVSLAGLFYEPVWVWYREESFKSTGSELTQLTQLRGKRVAIGNQGSGTLALSKKLLQANGLGEKSVLAEYLTTDEAYSKLVAGKLDAVFTVSASEAPVLEKFLSVPGIRLMNFDQADAYTRQFPFLTKVDIPRGLLSIQYDRPRREIAVIAPTASLVSRSNVSPALVSLILGDSYDILKSYSRLQKPGQFPSQDGLDFALQADAEIYLKDGPSFLHRHLPFWTAVWVGRIAKILIPLLAILIPLATYVPSLQNFRLKLKLSKIYAQLKNIERNALDPANDERNLRELSAIEGRLNSMKISQLDAKELYDLKGHVNMVSERLKLIHESPRKT